MERLLKESIKPSLLGSITEETATHITQPIALARSVWQTYEKKKEEAGDNLSLIGG